MKKRFSGFEFWDGAVFGALVGVVATLGLSWGLAVLSIEYWSVSGDIFAVVGVLFAALIALKGVRSQIETQLKINEENRKQELEAYRATLPLAISQLVTISINGMRASLSVNSTVQISSEEVEEMLGMPEGVLDTLRNCIKSSDEISQRWLSSIISNYQIYYSRSRKLPSMALPHTEGMDKRAEHARLDLALDWATLHALVEHVFGFSRGSADTIPVLLNAERINSALWLEGIVLDEYHDFETLVEARVKRLGMAEVSDFER